MNILILNGSPFGRRGLTSVILKQFTAGAREAGASIDEVFVNQLSVNPCRGDLSCWFRTNGKCIQHDDMEELLPRIDNADIIVFSTPVFFDGISGKLKLVIDRMVALANPFLEIRDGHTRHPLSENHKEKYFVLIASCGLWEIDNFDPIILHVKAICKNAGYIYSGALLRPHSFAMKDENIDDILKASKKAGNEIITQKTISTDLEQAVSRPILSREAYIDVMNKKVQSLRYPDL